MPPMNDAERRAHEAGKRMSAEETAQLNAGRRVDEILAQFHGEVHRVLTNASPYRTQVAFLVGRAEGMAEGLGAAQPNNSRAFREEARLLTEMLNATPAEAVPATPAPAVPAPAMPGAPTPAPLEAAAPMRAPAPVPVASVALPKTTEATKYPAIVSAKFRRTPAHRALLGNSARAHFHDLSILPFAKPSPAATTAPVPDKSANPENASEKEKKDAGAEKKKAA